MPDSRVLGRPYACSDAELQELIHAVAAYFKCKLVHVVYGKPSMGLHVGTTAHFS